MIFLAPTKPLVHQQMEACQQFMGSAKVCLTVFTMRCRLSDVHSMCALPDNIASCDKCQHHLQLLHSPGCNHTPYVLKSVRSTVQVNSVVMDGHVNKEERLGLWNSSHRRIIFATPQAFKNDVFKGQSLHLCPDTSHSLASYLATYAAAPGRNLSARNKAEAKLRILVCICWTMADIAYGEAAAELKRLDVRCAGICPYEKITCVVVDECHRAVGNDGAVLSIAKMRQDQGKFRVLGLSATPGSKREAIQVPDEAFLLAHATRQC